ncbi:MAG: ubiquinone/menaquinone biosynthesis methyltransferase [Thermomicrobiales bacterium]|nr:ubiquinone/menaquinone biosynthesis methyltransferase [Thermomicrobiales bacterium]
MKETSSGQASGAIKSSDDVREMFDGIVPRYDLLNRLMTGGRDVAWRKLTVREAARHVNPAAASALDIATGTGDLALALERAGFARVVGLDFSAPMLAEAARKAQAQPGAASLVTWLEGDAMALPFADETFDAVTVGFGLRNMPDYLGALREVVRVLKPGGTFVCLETSPLPAPALRAVYETAMSVALPLLGGLLSGDRDAYAYLPRSSSVFPDAEALGRLMLAAGFRDVRYLRRGLGAVAIHVGRKPAVERASETL